MLALKGVRSEIHCTSWVQRTSMSVHSSEGRSFRNSLLAVEVDAPTTLLTPVCGGLVHMETQDVFILSPLPLGMGTIDLLKRF
jgi:hypothetical protein